MAGIPHLDFGINEPARQAGYHSMIASLGHGNPDRRRPSGPLVKEALPVARLNGLTTKKQ